LVLAALVAQLRIRPAQTVSTRQLLQLPQQAEVVVVVRRLAQLDRQAVRAGAKAVTHLVLALVQQIKVTGAELLALAAQIHTQAAVAVLAQWVEAIHLVQRQALVALVFLQVSQVLL